LANGDRSDMATNLNDTIDSLFRGLVFVLIDFIASLATLLARPISGAVILVRKLRSHDTNQVRPYVFLFLSFVLAFSVAPFLEALSVERDPHEYTGTESSQPAQNALKQIYEGVFAQIESKAVLAIIIASMVGVTIFHLGARLTSSLLFAKAIRRSIAMDSLFYVAGAQIVLIGLIFLLMRQQSIVGIDEAPNINVLLTSVHALPDLLRPANQQSAAPWIEGLKVLSLLLLILLPAPICFKLARRRRLWLPWLRQGLASVPFASPVIVALMILAVEFSTAVAFSAAGFVRDNIEPRAKGPYEIQEVSCRAERRGLDDYVIATAVVTATGAKPWLFADGDFRMWISAPGTPQDHDNEKSKKTGRAVIPDMNTTTATPNGHGPVLVEPTKSALLLITAKLPTERRGFLEAHRNNRTCTISAAGDYVIGKVGYLDAATP